MELSNILEALMLVCFGASWPFSIIKALRTKVVRGKSPVFLSLIILGYIFGIAKMISFHYEELARNPGVAVPWPWLLWFYVGLIAIVSVDTVLYILYRHNK